MECDRPFLIGIAQWFSNFNMHQNYPGLFKHRLLTPPVLPTPPLHPRDSNSVGLGWDGVSHTTVAVSRLVWNLRTAHLPADT